MAQAHNLVFSNRYRSPRNPERNARTATRLIVLHTTEAPAKSSLNKLSERGEANYCVVEDGTVYRIVDVMREAFHAGRSIWQHHEDCDTYSIGIEVVGYHNQPVTLAQLDALRELIAILKRQYNLTDEQVVCHSHVAYGVPNKWHPRKHRGRKRCGMLFAMPSVRTQLGLKSRPASDPDLRNGRLIQGDAYLHSVLYGNVDTMRAAYKRSTTKPQPTPAPTKPQGTIFSNIANIFKKGKLIKSTPSDTSTTSAPIKKGPLKSSNSPKSNSSPRLITPPVSGKEDVWYVTLDGRYLHESQLKSGDKLPFGTRTLKGYILAGPIDKTRSASSLAGSEWNSKDTYYLVRGALIRGDQVDEKRIEKGSMIFFRKR